MGERHICLVARSEPNFLLFNAICRFFAADGTLPLCDVVYLADRLPIHLPCRTRQSYFLLLNARRRRHTAIL